MKRSHFAAALSVAFAGQLAHAQVLTPIDFTYTGGTTGDAIVGPAPGDTTKNISVDASFFFLTEQGQKVDEPTFGIPDSVFLSESNTATKIASFTFGPSNGNNILKGDGTLTLATPSGFSNISFLVQNLTSPGVNPATFTLNFADSTTEVFNTAGPVPYWVGGDPTASGGTVALGPVGALFQGDGNYNGSGLNFDEYDFTLDAADVGKTVTSISVNANGEQLRTYAVSGTIETAPEPGTWAMLLTGAGLLAFAGRFVRVARL